jgi:hypothetical protein
MVNDWPRTSPGAVAVIYQLRKKLIADVEERSPHRHDLTLDGNDEPTIDHQPLGRPSVAYRDRHNAAGGLFPSSAASGISMPRARGNGPGWW